MLEVLSVPTPPLPSPERAIAWLVALIGFVFLVVPRPLGWLGDHVWAEDGAIFLAEQSQIGIPAWLSTYGGYVHLVPRVLATAIAPLPLEWFPVVTLVVTALIRVAAYLCAARLFAAYLGSARWGVAAAATLLFVPSGQWEVIGNITNLRWIMDVIVVVLLLSSYRRAHEVVLAGAALFAASLSDPLVIGMAPLMVLRLITERGSSRLPAISFAAGALVQAMLMQGGQRTIPLAESFLSHPLDLITQLALRGPLSTQFGITTAGDLAAAGLPALLATAFACVVLAASVLPTNRNAREWSRRAGFLIIWTGAGVALLTATLVFVSLPQAAAWAPADIPGRTPRYTALLCLFLSPVLVAGWQSLLAVRGPLRVVAVLVSAASVLALASGVVRDFRGYPPQFDTPSWRAQLEAAQEACRSGEGPSGIEVSPAGWGGIELACDGSIRTLHRDR